MKRKLFLTAVTVIMITSCAIGFAACGDDTHEEHVLTHVAATEATCTENGNSEYWSCSDCGKYFSDAQATTEISRSDTVVPAKGHTYGEWEIIKEATCTEDGTEERECSVCHATEQQAVPSAGHAFSADWSYDDTEHWHACQNCGEVRGTAAHTYVGGVCSVCGAHEPSVGLEYALNHDGTGYSVQGMGSCTDTDIVIPSAYNGLPVTSVGESAFYNCTALTSIVLPDGVTSIGESAFYNCTALTSIIIPDSVTTIEKSAFLYCSSLASITIPDSVTEIKDNAFSGCRSLARVTLPDSITSIGKYVFYLCYDLKSITIPDSVIEIEDYAFSACTGLESIAFPSSVESIGKYSFSDCTSLTTLSIPENVTHIDEYAFNHCTALTNIVLHEKMGNIMRGVFSDCTSLTSITIPDRVIDISTNAFENCSSLEGYSSHRRYLFRQLRVLRLHLAYKHNHSGKRESDRKLCVFRLHLAEQHRYRQRRDNDRQCGVQRLHFTCKRNVPKHKRLAGFRCKHRHGRNEHCRCISFRLCHGGNLSFFDVLRLRLETRLKQAARRPSCGTKKNSDAKCGAAPYNGAAPLCSKTHAGIATPQKNGTARAGRAGGLPFPKIRAILCR